MPAYFVEYEFKSTTDDQYWFPLQINSANQTDAEVIARAVRTALSENYHDVRNSVPLIIVAGINSDLLRDYTTRQLRGRIRKLNARVWQFFDCPGIPELNFSQHLDIVTCIPENIYDHSIATVIGQHQFPVRQLTNNLQDFEEFLLINVVNPAAA